VTEPRENAARNTHNVVERLLCEGRSESELRAMRVLDIPCGQGAFTQRLLHRGMQVVPSDVIEDARDLPGCESFAAANMDEPLPFGDGAFTHVVCIDGIEHIERTFDFVRECRRVLAPGGSLLISTPNVSSVRSRWRFFLTGHHNKCKTPLNETDVTPLHHKSMLSFPELRYMLHTNGFGITRVTTNRAKAISYIYALVFPLLNLVTRRVYAKEERDPGQRARNREILKTMFSAPVYFGETLIVIARRQ